MIDEIDISTLKLSPDFNINNTSNSESITESHCEDIELKDKRVHTINPLNQFNIFENESNISSINNNQSHHKGILETFNKTVKINSSSISSSKNLSQNLSRIHRNITRLASIINFDLRRKYGKLSFLF